MKTYPWGPRAGERMGHGDFLGETRRRFVEGRNSPSQVKLLRITACGWEGQGQREDAVGGVQVAEFAGHRAGSAVYLVH